MGRPRLEIGTYGSIARQEVSPGRWRARTRFRDHDGITRVVERYGATGAKAEKTLKAALRDRKRLAGGTDINPDTPLSVLADAWIAELQEAGRPSLQTIEKYQGTIRRHIEPALGEVLIREASTGTLERFFTAVEGPSTGRWCRIILTGMFGLAARRDAVEHNPVRDTTVRHRESKPVRAMEAEEVRQLRANVEAWAGSNRMGPRRAIDLPEIIDVLLGTGLRIGECLGLRWSDIDLDERTATIVGTVVQPDSGPVYWQAHPKTAAGRRTVLLPTYAVAALRRHQDRGWPSEHDAVFPTARGTWRSPNNVRRQLRGARGESLEWVTPHTLRKTNATVIERAAGMAAAQAQLGHSSPTVTERHYVQRASRAGDHRQILDDFVAVSDGFSVGKDEESGEPTARNPASPA